MCRRPLREEDEDEEDEDERDVVLFVITRGEGRDDEYDDLDERADDIPWVAVDVRPCFRVRDWYGRWGLRFSPHALEEDGDGAMIRLFVLFFYYFRFNNNRPPSPLAALSLHHRELRSPLYYLFSVGSLSLSFLPLNLLYIFNEFIDKIHV